MGAGAVRASVRACSKVKDKKKQTKPNKTKQNKNNQRKIKGPWLQVR